MHDHVAKAVEAELLSPYHSEGRAEQAALAACTTLAFMAASQIAPVGGPVAVAAVAGAFAPTFRRDASERKLEQKIDSQVQEALDEEMSARVLPGQPEDARVKAWQAWLDWSALRRGDKIPAPPDMPHPSLAGFEYTRLASRVGQACDWVCSLPDGSRLHAHEFPDGRIVVHRDKLDPAHGAAPAVIHWMAEAREGQILAVLTTLGVLAAGFSLANQGKL